MMNNFRLALRTSALFAVIFLFVSVVQAQASRTWVSGVGNDLNACSRAAPCKTFAGAIAKTNTGGEITVMDPGGFGPVIIRKSITIDGTGIPSSILAALATGITIDIRPSHRGDIARSVRIRGLSINGMGNGINGINVIAANKVSVEDCVIDGFTVNGINVQTGVLFVRNTTIRNNTGAGINVAGAAEAGISDTTVIFNGTGLAGAVVKYCCVVLYGNKNGDPPRP
jgi:hypothetical protein